MSVKSIISPEEILNVRTLRGETQEEFAGKMKVSTKTVGNWEKGTVSLSNRHLNKFLELKSEIPSNIQNIYGTNAQGTQIIGDGQTTNNNGQSCEDTKEQTSNTGKLLDAHVSLMEQMRQLIEVVKSQQETISHLVVHKK